VLQKLRAETVRAVPAGARMQISPEQGQLMALLVEASARGALSKSAPSRGTAPSPSRR